LTHVLVLPYRNPLLVAKAAASLDVLSGGRLLLGVAAGYLAGEFAALGADLARRHEAVDEAIRAVRAAWRGAPFDFAGTGYAARGIEQRPPPVQRPGPPIWVGGNAPRAIRRAVELGDGWLPFPAPAALAGHVRSAAIASLDDLRAGIARAREHAARIGRRAPLEIGFTPFCAAMDAAAPPAPQRLADEVAALAELGVTWCMLTVPASSRAAWCEH